MRDGVEAGPLRSDLIRNEDRLALDAVASRRVGRPMSAPPDGEEGGDARRSRRHSSDDGEQSVLRSKWRWAR